MRKTFPKISILPPKCCNYSRSRCRALNPSGVLLKWPYGSRERCSKNSFCQLTRAKSNALPSWALSISQTEGLWGTVEVPGEAGQSRRRCSKSRWRRRRSRRRRLSLRRRRLSLRRRQRGLGTGITSSNCKHGDSLPGLVKSARSANASGSGATESVEPAQETTLDTEALKRGREVKCASNSKRMPTNRRASSDSSEEYVRSSRNHGSVTDDEQVRGGSKALVRAEDAAVVV